MTTTMTNNTVALPVATSMVFHNFDRQLNKAEVYINAEARAPMRVFTSEKTQEELLSNIEKVVGVTDKFYQLPGVQELVSKLQEGTEYYSYEHMMIVGGCVRDTLLDTQVADVDIFIEQDMSTAIVLNALGYVLDGENNRYLKKKSYKKTQDGVTYNVVTTRLNLIEEVLSFTADIAKLGASYWISKDCIAIENVFLQGLDSIESKEVVFKGESVLQARRYASKLTQKEWAKDFTFKFEDGEICHQIPFLLGDSDLTDDLHRDDYLFNGFFHSPEMGAAVALQKKLVEFIHDVRARYETFKTNFSFDETLAPLYGFSLYFPTEAVFEAVRGWYVETNDVDGFIINEVPKFAQKYEPPTAEKNYDRREIYLKTALHQSEGWGLMEDLSPEGQELLAHGKKRLALVHPAKLATPKWALSLLTSRGFRDNMMGHGNPSNGRREDFSGYNLEGWKLKPKHLAGKRYIPSDLLAMLSWSAVLGEAAANLSPYWLQHYSDAGVTEVPAKFAKQISMNDSLMKWVFEYKLDIDWTVANGPRACVIKSIMNVHGLTEANAEKLFENPSMLKALEFARYNDNSHVVVDPAFPTKTYVTADGQYTLEMLDKHSTDNLIIGDLTGCCQHLGGAARDVCITSWFDPNSVNYVIRSTSSGNIYSHFWAWIGDNGLMVLDSLEGRHDAKLIEATLELVTQFVVDNKKNLVVSNTHYGYTQSLRERLLPVLGQPSEAMNMPYPKWNYGFNGYGVDADVGVVAYHQDALEKNSEETQAKYDEDGNFLSHSSFPKFTVNRAPLNRVYEDPNNMDDMDF